MMDAPDAGALPGSQAASSTEAAPLLAVRGLRVAFGGKAVVHGIDFEIAAGEKIALVGESGSGKSVSALSLMRLLHEAQVGGQALYQSADGPVDLIRLPEARMRGLRGRELAVIFQEPMTALNPLFTVGDQIVEVLVSEPGMDRARARVRAIALLAETGIPQPEQRVDAYPHQLSGGQRQRAMIAMSLACQPRLLIADEPTTALDVGLRAQILDLLDSLQQRHGMAVLMITHDLNLVRRFARRVVVMERGHVVEQGPVDQVFAQPAHPYTRALLDSRPRRNVAEVPAAGKGADPHPLLQARGLRVSYPVRRPGVRGWFRRGEFVAVQGADFAVRQGETLGVVGESGSGKSTLALAALGLLPAQGHLAIGGVPWSGRPGTDRPLRQRVQVVFQDPYASLSPRMTVREIVGEGLALHAPQVSRAEREERVRSTLAEVGLSPDSVPSLLDRYPHEFSGGQRQRLAIARALIVGPALLVLDEPTSALDVTVQKQVLDLLQRLQRERQLSYLLITHDVDVVRAMAHQVMVMHAGQVVEAGPVDQVLGSPVHPYTQTLVRAAG